MSLPIPTPAALAQRFAAALAQQTFVAADGTPVTLDATAPATLEQALSILSGLSDYELYLHIRDQMLEQNVTTATVRPGIGLLPRHAQMWSVPRLGATAAIGYFIISASYALSIPTGTLLTVDGSVQWSVNETVAIAGGASASVAVTAISSGISGNLPANTSAEIVSPISGVTSVTSDQDGIAGGAAIEDVESWRARIIAKIRTPGGTGLASDYVEWAKEGGASYVSVLPITNGGGAISVFVVMAGGVVPTPAQVDFVQATIDAARPVCAKPTVYAGQIAYQNLSIRLRPDSMTARAAVTSALASFFLNAGMGATLYRDAIAVAIASVNGSTNDLIAPDGDIALAPYQLAMLGTITWTTQ